MDKIPMTAEGYSALESELKHCQQVERPRIIQQITDARTHGDLSENAEYHAAKETQSINEGRIAELEDKLARAEVIDVSKLSGDTITFGATVTLIDEDTDKKTVWQIVGEPEADAKKGKISITSPLARALVGKKKGAQEIGCRARICHRGRCVFRCLMKSRHPSRPLWTRGLRGLHSSPESLDRNHCAGFSAKFHHAHFAPGHQADRSPPLPQRSGSGRCPPPRTQRLSGLSS